MKSMLTGIVCFSLGLGLGIWSSTMKESINVETATISLEGSQNDEAPDEVVISVTNAEDPLEPESPDISIAIQSSPQQVTVSTSLIELLSQREGNRTMGQALLDPGGAIEQSLQISDEEKTVIETSLESTKLKIQALEAKSSTVEELEDYSVKITLPDISQQVQGLREQFSSSVYGALGQNRGEVFLAAKQIKQLMAKSVWERTYTIAAESPKEGEWRFNMTLESPNGRRVWGGDSIPKEIRHLTDAAQILPTISDLPE